MVEFAPTLIEMAKAEHNPADPRNRDWTRERQRELRALLVSWDPIGIAGAPEGEDEYDCMISPLLHKLYDGAAAAEVEAWLVAELEEHFELAPDLDREAALARTLTEWWSTQTVR